MGRFCPGCGQDVARRLGTIPAFLKRTAAEASDLQGPVWRTLWLIFRRPGALTREYSERRFRAQVSPVRLYLVVAALFYLLFPIWSRWILRDDGQSLIYFETAATLALSVPVWAAVVQLTTVDRKTYFEQAFVYSAHYHVAYFSLFTVMGFASALLGTLGVTGLFRIIPFYLLVLVLAPLYVFVSLRTAYGIGRLRSALTALVLVVGHIILVQLIQALMGEGLQF